MICSVFSNQLLDVVAAIALALITVIGAIVSYTKMVYWYRSKMLFITNVQILHMDL